MGELLDSGTLDGMLDTDANSAVQPGRPDPRNPRYHHYLQCRFQCTMHPCTVFVLFLELLTGNHNANTNLQVFQPMLGTH